jgi:periplasmic divalent cation tolerance protein
VGDRRPALIWSPFPDEKAALFAAETLIDLKLAACGNVIGGITSTFVWSGGRERAQEVGLLVKTSQSLLAEAVKQLSEIHPYDEPAIVGWNCDTAAPETADWLGRIGRMPE